MRRLGLVAVSSLFVVACNAVLGLDQVTRNPNEGEEGGDGSGATGGSPSGGSAGSVAKGGTGGLIGNTGGGGGASQGGGSAETGGMSGSGGSDEGGEANGGSSRGGSGKGGASTTGGSANGGSANGGTANGGIANAGTGGSANGGKANSGGASSGGTSAGGASTGGKANTGGTSTGGASAGGASTGGKANTGGTTGGAAAGGTNTGGKATGGATTGGTTGGTATGGTGTGGTTGGTATGGSGGGGTVLAKFSFFVTSLDALRARSGSQNGFGGDLRFGEATGLAGADKICTQIAEKSMAGASTKIWRAFLSTTTVNAKDRIGPGPWYDRIGRVVAADLTGLLGNRPAADAAIANDLPNEDGVPNRSGTGTGADDNHDMITGTDASGNWDGGSTCNDWTSAVGAGGPRVGHSWPRGATGGGVSWVSSHAAPGCVPSVSLVEMGGGTDDGIGNGGGYGGFYCFALSP